ncbi:hypothetical protein [Ralstonia sp. GP71]|uniref:hypothetical protein n=1 Tax=Ralstonia sp. GP71 TaxID=3035152 RepID=UPI003892C867
MTGKSIASRRRFDTRTGISGSKRCRRTPSCKKLDIDIAALRQLVRNIEQDLAAFDDFRDVRRMLKSRPTLD